MTERSRPPTPRWVLIVLAVVGALLAAFILLHLTGRGFGHGLHGAP